ncbi:MAG: 3D-(3,5/4)-trihydroxycyclohexane-1,2-dione acylhydrolase (decyclizing) [Candidatus Nanopelagicales bacterium]|jgi:3D-(3,5/4)-trihydroxycyclohexane-1,2-dione acylhydrolase (decyclizing)|nr:3D-(3,5/4)-trihydroxycyclohexane-1,2-dione acylhydrolase (decyclizing) [Candidatus Nanopelagicales bacterium]
MSQPTATGTVRLTVAEAMVRFLIAQRTKVDGVEVPLFPGVLAIFGHGNVTSLGHSLEQHRDEIPVWRGQNEQGMGLAAAAFTKAQRRQQIMIATSSVGPGATNMITAAGVAMANRLPVLFISGDTFTSRLPDPVLQQVEHFGSPSTTVNDAFRSVVRYWDRITHPAQIISSLPHAVATMLDPADCGPVFIGLPQDVAADAYDYPVETFEPVVHAVARPRPDIDQLAAAAALLRSAKRPVIIAGGGVHYSLAEAELAAFSARTGIPVVETVAGKSSLLADHPSYAGPVGVTGAEAANAVVEQADLVLAIGCRLQDFTTGSWTLFDRETSFIGLNAARFDAGKHRAQPLVCDAREGIVELDAALADWSVSGEWQSAHRAERENLDAFITSRIADDREWPPSYAQLVGLVHDSATPADYVLTAAGGLPGELNINWRSKGIATFDCEYGFSCMGYEISGAWGAAFARSEGQVYSMVGDGSYLMMNSDIYASVLSGKKFILVVCDNEGYAVIERLQVGQGGASYNNMLKDSTGTGSEVRVDFAAHAAAMGATVLTADSLTSFRTALDAARAADRTAVIVTSVRDSDWTEGGAFWQVGVPEVSEKAEVRQARASMDAGLARQRKGV